MTHIVVVLAIHQHESAMGAHVSSHPARAPHLPPHPVSLDCPRAPALSALLHAFFKLLTHIHVLINI